jgi:hypothetical protein
MSNPSQSEYWSVRYISGDTPWDFGGIPADLKEYLRCKPKGGRVLIPGCGWGYEVQAFADAGYDVTAIDFSPEAVDRAHRLVNPALAGCITVRDFFDPKGLANASFDLVYERTFLCAIMPDRREDYRDRVARLLKYGGSLVGYFYYQNTDPNAGPPFGLAWGEGDALFSRHFILGKDVPVSDSLPVFAGRERWQERRRNSSPCLTSHH